MAEKRKGFDTRGASIRQSDPELLKLALRLFAEGKTRDEVTAILLAENSKTEKDDENE